MTTTVRVSNIDSEGWTELADGSANVTVDHDRELSSDVLIWIGAADPTAAVNDGFRLTSKRPTFAIAGLEAGDKVFARSTDAELSVLVAKS
jgi:hypothetical protein